MAKWTRHMNSCHPTIKFTVESSKDRIVFLDTVLHIDRDTGELWTDLYSKPTDSHNYLHFGLAHPNHCKRSIPFNQFLRIRCICSHEEDFIRHSVEMKYHFLRRGYRTEDLNQAFSKVMDITLQEARTIIEEPEEDERPYLVSTYHPNDDTLREIVTKNWEVLQQSSTTKSLEDMRPAFGYRRPKQRHVGTAPNWTNQAPLGAPTWENSFSL